MPIYIGSDQIAAIEKISDVFQGFTRISGEGNSRQTPEASDFETASGVTDATALAAINDFVINAQNRGVWDKLIAFYPFVGTDFNKSKINLVDTGSYTLTFEGTGTANYTRDGFKPNGSSNFLEAPFNPNDWTNANASYGWSLSETGSTSFPSLGICQASTAGADEITARTIPGSRAAVLGNTESGCGGSPSGGAYTSAISSSVIITRTDGYAQVGAAYIVDGVNESGSGYFQTTIWGDDDGTRNEYGIPLGAQRVKTNFDDQINAYDAGRFSTFFIGYALTETEAADLDYCIDTLNRTLNRPYQNVF